jgi:hypothetical protein
MTTLVNAIASLERRIPGKADHIDMLNAINVALNEIGFVTQVDETLTVVADQTEYALPTGVGNVVRVEIANSTSGDYDYTRVYTWKEINGYLYFPSNLGFSTGNKIRIYYNGIHADVEEDTDTIEEGIPIPLLMAEAHYWYEKLQYMEQSNMGAKEETILQRLDSERLAAWQRYRVRRLMKDPTHWSYK